MRVLAFALLIHSMVPWFAVGASSPEIPTQVAEITRRQIERYLGTNDFKGVPLLDRAVDWSSFDNWPDRYSYKGLDYRLRLTDLSGGDALVLFDYRSLAHGFEFQASYSTGSDFPPLQVSSVWSSTGSVLERAVSLHGKCVFGYQFYPTGQLFCFRRDDAETKDYSMEYFDDAGRLVGTYKWTGTKRRCEWDGVVVDRDTLDRETRGMYRRLKK